jgi:signal transduction histidine kinase/ligand-binding sensor domain-containing protein
MNFRPCFFAWRLACFVLLSSGLFTMNPAQAQLNPQNITHYTEKDGLPGSEVVCVISDKLGYIWIGTNNGLTRYDGYTFKRYYYNPNDTASLHGIIVESLYEDSKGKIWVSTSPSNLAAYDPATRKFRQYNFNGPPGVAINGISKVKDIMTICEDNNGRIYFGAGTFNGETIGSALLYKDANSDSIEIFKVPDSLDLQNIVRIRKDMKGNVWMLGYSGVFTIDSTRKLSKWHSLDQEFVNHHFPVDFQFDKSNHLWIITNNLKLYEYNGATGGWRAWSLVSKNRNWVFDNNRPIILIDNKDNIWIGISNGLQLFNPVTGLVSSFRKGDNQGMSETTVHDFTVDSFGTVWIGAHENGLFKYEEKPQLKSYIHDDKDPNSITSGWVAPIIETSDSNIWVLSLGSVVKSGFSKLDTRTGVISPLPFPKFFKAKVNGLSTFWENQPGELYLAGYPHLYSFSEKTHQVKSVLLPGIPDTIVVTGHCKDSRGSDWIASFRAGLYKKAKGSTQYIKYDVGQLPGSNETSSEIQQLYESRKNGLWILTNNGLFFYNYGTDKIVRWGYDKNAGDVLISQDVNSLYEDPHGVLWIGTWGGGLSRYNPDTKKIKIYTREDGLPSMSVQSILADEKNSTLWIATFDGLSRFDLKTEQFSNYSIADGIQSQLFADASFLKTSNGRFAFGGSNGFTIFNPDSASITSTPPRVFLTELKLYNKPVIPGENSILKKPIYETKEITLNHDQNNISLDFIALHYSNPSMNRYSYILENFDKEWRDAGNGQSANYPNLPPGKYIFRVKAANDKGVWNKEGATLAIIVNPPWWKTTWAYILYAVLFIVFSFGVNRYLRGRLLEKEREKARVRELEHAKEIEKAYYKLEETHEELKSTQVQLIQSEKMASLGELTAGIAHEIQNPLNFVNNFSEVNREMIAEMKAEIEKGNYEEVKTIAENIESNEEKISHHGKRADSIVKGMLLHSRAGSGSKEPTDINAIAEEYLSLSYHGFRAKDGSFNAVIETDFDISIRKVIVTPQDIGRVLLNIFNNAFYAVAEKKKQMAAGSGYQPTVIVSTKKTGSELTILIRDNGNGIPQKVLDKIFQPFFTTKPPGQGTGLGLSLSYDIIRAHQGEIKVETKEGEGTLFSIGIPV